MRRSVVIAVLLLLASCAALQPTPDMEPELRVEGETLYLRGTLHRDRIEEFQAALDEHADDLKWLDIESGGGEVEASLYMGALVFSRGLNVRVSGIGCVSSCANYIFPAGRKKQIMPGAVVAWHGSAIQSNLAEGLSRDARASLEEWRERQARLYRMMEVDERITIVGQDLNCDCTWALSVEDMARFGLTGVEAPDDYEETDLSWARGPGIRFLSLPEDVFERIRAEGEVREP